MVKEDYMLTFMEKRKEFRTRKDLSQLQENWVKDAAKKMDATYIEKTLDAIQRKTSRSGLFNIAVDLEKKVGANPLFFAHTLKTLEIRKSYLTGLLCKVREELKIL